MFEARLLQGGLLKKVVEAIKDFVTEANFDCASTSISLQAMDKSHVALVSLCLRREGFDHYRCDRNLSLGINVESLSKILKCAGPEDVITLKAVDKGDIITFMFENPSQDRMSDFDLKLMDIDGEHLGIPDDEYVASVTMPSSEFQKICRDLKSIGDTVEFHASKDGLAFKVSGDLGNGSIICRQSTSVDGAGEDSVTIDLDEEINLSFGLSYLNNITKATAISPTVTLRMKEDAPVMVEYMIEDMGYLRYFLAPKMENEE